MIENMPVYTWTHATNTWNERFTCGHCGADVGSDKGWDTGESGRIRICPNCTQPTYLFELGGQIPGVRFGEQVAHLPDKVGTLYEEARQGMSVSAFTSAAMLCRKLLMHIAVDKGAVPGLTFAKYVEFLDDKGYIPPDGKQWVDYIRTKANEANRELVVFERSTAERLTTFTAMLLRFVYEFPEAFSEDE